MAHDKFEPKLKPAVDPKNPNYYLDKEEMREALREHRDACNKAEAEGIDIPGVSNYLGKCFLDIAKGLAMNHNFRRYSYINDMMSEGVLTCIKYVRSCDPEKISDKTGKLISPLAYFTQVCYFAFLNKIKAEKKETDVKWALLLDADLDLYTIGEDSADFTLNMADFMKSLGPQGALESRAKKPKKVEIPEDPLGSFSE